MAKILIYAMNYAPEWVGVGRCTAEIGERLADLGHEVEVVTTPPHYPEWKLRAPYEPYRWYKERSGRQTIFRCPLFLRERMGGLWRLVAPLSFAINSAPVVIWRILRARPDSVLLVEPTLLGAPAALAAAWITGATRVLHVQDLEVDAAFAVGHLASLRLLKPLTFSFERLCLMGFDRVVTISAKMAQRLAAKGVDETKIEIVRNWVDLDRIRPIDGESLYRCELGFADDDRVVLYSGALGAKQDFDTVLAAVALLVGRKHVKFVVAGEGPARAAIAAQAATVPNLMLLPFQPENRLRDFLGLADVHLLPQAAGAADLVLPSKLGGMLASGRPIVAMADAETELAAFLGGAARLVAPGDPAALAQALAETLGRGRETASEIARRALLAARLSKTEGLRAIAAVLTQAKPALAAPVGIGEQGAP